jgi:hypothetical protein
MELCRFLVSVYSNLFSSVISETFGSKFGLLLIGVPLVLLLFITVNQEKRKREIRKKLQTLEYERSINEIELKTKYKGLISFISEPPRERKKEDWYKECVEKINKAKNENNINDVLELRTIGQTIKAINHHMGELKYFWMLYSDASGINKDIIEYFFKEITKNSITPIPVKIDDPTKIELIKEKIDTIYKKIPADIKIKDVICDITAGNKIMTAAMIISCLKPDCNIEYIEQNKNVLIEVDISEKFIAVEIPK